MSISKSFLVLVLSGLVIGCDSEEDGPFFGEVEFISSLYSEDGSPAAGAVVSVWANDRRYSDTTDANGRYSIVAPFDAFPKSGEMAMSISGGGTLPTSRIYSLPLQDGFQYTLGGNNSTLMACPNCVPVTNTNFATELWHLGDDNFSGSVNSQFQRSALTDGGIIFEFDLPTNATSFSIGFRAKGIQTSRCGGVINYGNRTELFDRQSLTDSPSDGSYGYQYYAFSVSGTGDDSIVIVPGQCSDDTDDFEFTDLSIIWQ